ncbi:hypothetical protein [Mangrovimonas sp. ST2L15]|uniref:hypothetical protein n=1 Tax=Mangrovimonas sp. ST2L15 TaxID=1645916 RepID=UPI000ABB4F3C|nr:hypothetical protein [Mangrovimonas sp. ST2L15]
MKTLLLTLCFVLMTPKLEVAKDPIIGTWKMTKLVWQYENGTTKDRALGKHALHKTFTYYGDGNLLFREYLYNDETDRFDLPGNEITKGTWIKGEGQEYQREMKRYYGDKLSSSYPNSSRVFVFSEDQNSMQITTDFEKDGTIFEGDNKPVKEVAYFVRMR